MSLLLTYPCVAISFRLIGLPIKTLSLAVWPPVAATLVMLVVVQALKAALSPAPLPRDGSRGPRLGWTGKLRDCHLVCEPTLPAGTAA